MFTTVTRDTHTRTRCQLVFQIRDSSSNGARRALMHSWTRDLPLPWCLVWRGWQNVLKLFQIFANGSENFLELFVNIWCAFMFSSFTTNIFKHLALLTRATNWRNSARYLQHCCCCLTRSISLWRSCCSNSFFRRRNNAKICSYANIRGFQMIFMMFRGFLHQIQTDICKEQLLS